MDGIYEARKHDGMDGLQSIRRHDESTNHGLLDEPGRLPACVRSEDVCSGDESGQLYGLYESGNLHGLGWHAVPGQARHGD